LKQLFHDDSPISILPGFLLIQTSPVAETAGLVLSVTFPAFVAGSVCQTLTKRPDAAHFGNFLFRRVSLRRALRITNP
jgi:hypothetical protein